MERLLAGCEVPCLKKNNKMKSAKANRVRTPCSTLPNVTHVHQIWLLRTTRSNTTGDEKESEQRPNSVMMQCKYPANAYMSLLKLLLVGIVSYGRVYPDVVSTPV